MLIIVLFLAGVVLDLELNDQLSNYQNILKV